MDRVYYTPWDLHESMLGRMKACIEATGILESLDKGDLVAVKIHPGEHGSPNYVRPMYVRAVCEMLREVGARPFVTDTTTYYRVKRHNAHDAMVTAGRHGFVWTDIPFIVADGLKGENFVRVKAEGMLDEVEVAGAIYEADAMIAISHSKGHLSAGYGGAIKNLGMGCVSKRSKLDQHRTIGIHINPEMCVGCGQCVLLCPFGCIVVKGEKAEIDKSQCMRCFICGGRCPQGAISLSDRENLCRALASAAKAVLSSFSPEKTAFVNLAVDIYAGCDCVSRPGKHVAEDLGIYVSRSPVSADAAVLGEVGATLHEVNGVDPWVQVDEALAIGIKGSREPVLERM